MGLAVPLASCPRPAVPAQRPVSPLPPAPALHSYEPHSYGYRGDTGRKHHSTLPVRGEEYGPSFG